MDMLKKYLIILLRDIDVEVGCSALNQSHSILEMNLKFLYCKVFFYGLCFGGVGVLWFGVFFVGLRGFFYSLHTVPLAFTVRKK